MSNRIWIKQYHELLLSGKEHKAKKLKLDNLPRKLYKFGRLGNYYVNGVRNRQFWLAPVDTLNDPFECAFLFRQGDYFRAWVTQSNFIDDFYRKNGLRLRQEHIDEIVESNEPFNTFASICKRYGYTVQSTEGEFCAQEGEWQQQRATLRSNVKICSFTERLDSILMWSHYAEQHQGICAEYHVTIDKPMYDQIEPVLYTSDLYGFKAHRDFATNSRIFSMFKSPEWEYEREWRITRYETKSPVTVTSPKPTAIYLGAKYENNQNKLWRNELEVLAAKEKIPLYRMKIANSEYKMEVDLG